MTPLEMMLKRHEGWESNVYEDSKGISTIACGRNVQSVGLSDSEILLLLQNDIATRKIQLAAAFPCFSLLDPARQDALIDMAFMGIAAISEFTNMWAALASQNYIQAAKEALASEWASEVGGRATELAAMIQTGQYQESSPA